jgi:hypothetical protein
MDDPWVQAAFSLGIISLVLWLGTIVGLLFYCGSCCRRRYDLHYGPPPQTPVVVAGPARPGSKMI